MAGKGTYGAYAPLKGIGTGIGDALNKTEQAGFQYRAEERAEKERLFNQRKDISDNFGIMMEDLEFKETDIKSIDAPQYEFFIGAKEKVTELTDALLQNPDDTASRMKLSKVMASAKLLRGFLDKYGEWKQDFDAGMAEGKYDPFLNGDIPSQMEAAFKQGDYKILFDKNFDLQIVSKITGEEGEQLTTLNIPEFYGGNDAYKPVEKANKYAMQDQIAARFGTVDIEQDGNGGRTTSKYSGFDPAKTEDLKKEVDNQLGTDVNQLNNQAKSLIAQKLGRKPDGLTQEQFDQYRSEFAQEIINKFNTKTADKTDVAAIQRDRSLSQADVQLNQGQQRIDQANKEFLHKQSQDALAQSNLENGLSGKGKTTTATVPTDLVAVSTNKEGLPIRKTYKIEEKNEEGKVVKTNKISGIRYNVPNDKAPKIGNSVVKDIVLDDKTGKVHFNVVTTTTQKVKKNGAINDVSKTSEKLISSDAAVNDFARLIYYPDANRNFLDQKELSDYLVNTHNKRINQTVPLADKSELSAYQLPPQ
jgi:hypothetical protein